MGFSLETRLAVPENKTIQTLKTGYLRTNKCRETITYQQLTRK